MKKVLTLLGCLLLATAGFTQTDEAIEGAVIASDSERTPVLQLLYEEARTLEVTGTAAQIEANRLAIKAEWEAINPEIAALYKPIDNGAAYEQFGYDGTPYVAKDIVERPEIIPRRDWTTDLLIREDFIDGVDMEVAVNGDIYIGVYENEIDAGGSLDPIYIYRSTDDGLTFTLWAEEASPTPIRKLQLILISGSGDEYLIAYLMFEGGLFQGARWDLSTAAFDFETVTTEVTDFSVDKNYPGDTSGQRVFATFLKTTGCTEVYSARSTAGSYGFDWIDEVSIANICGAQVEFAYGRNGACYTTYTGATTGNLYTNVNDNFNDPASWMATETIVLGTNQETVDPIIKAARKSLATDEVIVFASSRDTGSTNGYNHMTYIRENGGAFSILWTGISLPNESTLHMDAWIRKENDVEEIRASYIRHTIDNSVEDKAQSFPYDGTSLTNNERVSDVGNEVYDGFAAAMAETNDNMPCMAFAGNTGGAAYGLYFDNKAGLVLATEDTTIDGLSYFPNPANDVLNVSAKNTIDSITLYNMLGQKVMQIKPNQNRATLDIASLVSGMYIMEISSNEKKGSYKLLKE